MNYIPHPKELSSIEEMLFQLLNLSRWSELTNGRCPELDKQALNCMIAFFWVAEAINSGKNVNITRIAKLAIARGFTKTLQCDIPEHNLDIIFCLGKVKKTDFTNYIEKVLAEKTSPAFAEFLKVDPESLEARIYKASTKVATLLELHELRRLISEKDFLYHEAQVKDLLAQYSDLPGYNQMLSENYMEIFRSYYKLRNRIRWAKHPALVGFSVLGHQFDVAVYGYMMSLAKHPDDEKLATNYFFMGIFHDFAESWTGDMPSPIKDAIPGLREATEQFENLMLKRFVYSKLPPYMEKALRAVMMEDEANTNMKTFLKLADNFAAFVECVHEIETGNRHQYYENVQYEYFLNTRSLPGAFMDLKYHLYRKIHPGV